MIYINQRIYQISLDSFYNHQELLMSAFQEQTNQYVEQIKAGANSILVAVRVRPLSQKEKKISNFETIKVLQGKLLSLVEPDIGSPTDILRKNRSKEIQYAFDYVFDKQVTTKTIYEQTVSILLDGLLDGYNASVLAYGATSCGKTFTMVGENENNPGIMAMAVLELLNVASQAKKYQDIIIKASYVQIYNQNIKDLLISEDRNLQIRQDPKQGISISGITEVVIDNLSQLKTVLKVGNKNRTMESTGCNDVSSRSHGIFQIRLQTRNKAQSTTDETIVSKLFLIDLAGSQRASNTTNKGLRMVQGAKINQSLLVLGNCIQALSDASQKGLKNAFVPYRGSKLTRLLKDSLGGNCRTVMIAHVAPAANLFQQTYNTLLYAHRAKNIKNNPIRNTLIAETHLSNYVNVINSLKKQNEELKNQLKQKEMNSPQKQRNSPYKYSVTLPVVENLAYNEEIAKYQSNIIKQFTQEEYLTQKISSLQLKIEAIAFIIFEKQLFKAEQQVIQKKSDEASQLSKQKLKLDKKLEQKVDLRNKILKQIEKNNILGSTGQSYLKNVFRQKKVELALKALKLKQELIKQEKRQIDGLLSKIKNSMRNRDNVIEKQKLLIKKNNIISRITYSQLDYNEYNDTCQVKSEGQRSQKSKKKVKPMSYKRLHPPNTKRQNKMKNSHSISIQPDGKEPEEQSIKERKQSGNKKIVKISKQTDMQIKNMDDEIKRKDRKQSPKVAEKLNRKKSEFIQKSSKVLYKSKSNKAEVKFDFVYLPH